MKLVALLAALFVGGAVAFLCILVVGYPMDHWVPRKYNWITVPLVSGVVIVLMGAAAVATYRGVQQKLARK